METIGGVSGAMLLGMALVLAVACIAVSVRSYRKGRVPGSGPRVVAAGLVLVSFSLVFMWMVTDSAVAESSPIIPAWLFEDSTAVVSGLVAGVTLLTLIMCWLIWGRANYRESIEVDRAFLESRGIDTESLDVE